ncbi:hypothetical protein TCAL_14355 [Tigriopus californicus]|uniref:Uncharacterized protein n=1 Tax=Tigriopus californicus TaxID=6832 RepID=A0A553NB98_TIGCA|nr:uncharacterized protein LOC131888941 [Tigriopus californicus]TRY62710.1 hypothetical protein TCAL_14355 [Tigriopus californicus]
MSSRIVRFNPGLYKPLYQKFRFFPSASPEKYGGSFLKNAMAEVPELLFCIPMLVFSFGVLAYRMSMDTPEIEKPFKNYYSVIRPDDPRIKFIDTRFYDACGAATSKAN